MDRLDPQGRRLRLEAVVIILFIGIGWRLFRLITIPGSELLEGEGVGVLVGGSNTVNTGSVSVEAGGGGGEGVGEVVPGYDEGPLLGER